jgi:hypothetical protein
MKGKRIFTFFASVCLVLSFITGIGNAQLPEFEVPSSSYPTIQAGINAAEAVGGGIVRVAAWTYNAASGETFPIIMKDGVQLIGAGAKVCILDAEGSPIRNNHTVIVCEEIFNPATRIEGFTVINGYDTSRPGGGISCVNSSLTIINNIIEGNYSQPFGGGIYSANSNLIIANNIIIGNSAYPFGGGVFCDSYSSNIIINNVIMRNGGNGWGGGIMNNSSDTTIMNNIVAENSALRGAGIYCGALPLIGYNNVYANFRENYSGCGPGPGDISVEPEFVDAANGDYHLQPYSLCVDAGTNDYLGYVDFDFEYHLRPLDGDGDDEAVVDIGADEIVPPPVARADDDRTVSADENGEASVTLDGSGSTDPDNEPLEYEWKDSLDNVIGTDPIITVTLDLGVHTFTLTVSSVNGTGTDEVVITVEDTTPPVPDLVPLPTLEGECSAEITTTPTASDNCTEGTIFGTTEDPLVYTERGTYTVTWAYTDESGNTITQTQTVIVEDTIPPAPDVGTLPTVQGECSAEVTTVPTATDNCAGSIEGTTDDPRSYTEAGTHTVTWTYDDGNGNTITQTQTVIVNDTIPPAPDVATLPTVQGECSATITTIPTATDNCAGSIGGTTDDPLSYTEQGTHTVTWTYADGNGNITEQTQTVIVQDTTPPVPDAETLPTVEGECSAEITTVPTATDNCAGSIEGTTADPLIYTENGPHTVTWIFTDKNGNTATQTQTVKVEDVTPPTIHLSDSTCVDMSQWKIANKLTVSATDNCTPDVELLIDKIKILNKGGRRVWGRGIYRVVGNDIYVFPNGRDWSIVVTVTAIDSNGNTTTDRISKPLQQCNRWSAQMARLLRLTYIFLWKLHRCW